jgi:hypothetical protein
MIFTVVYPRIAYTDLNHLRLLASFGEVECTGTSRRGMEGLSLRNSAVFLTLGWPGKCWKTPKRPRFANMGQEPGSFCKIPLVSPSSRPQDRAANPLPGALRFLTVEFH